MAGKASEYTKEKLSYIDDPRMPCKYGLKCYQKNKTHHEKYKHPVKRKLEENSISSDENDNVNEAENSIRDVEKTAKKKAMFHCSVEDVPEENLSTAIDSSSTKIEAEERSFTDTEISSPEDPKEFIKQKFLVEMPVDFYTFWEFCKSMSESNPANALSAIGLTLVGPFDVLSGKLQEVRIQDELSYLRHWRYYYDPPEFQTLIKGDDKKQYHMGYYRDDPKEMPVFVACNSAAVNCTISPLAGNLFGAINVYMDNILKSGNPFMKVKVTKLQTVLKNWAKKEGITLDTKTPAMIARAKKVVASIFHKGGIVVPYDKKNDLGYRELLEPDSVIKRILDSIVSSESETEKTKNFSKLQPIITAANIANDECDFGASLELGLDLFSFGGDVFHASILHLLQTSYKLLHRPQYATIIKAHLQNRLKDTDLSIIK